MAPPCSHWSVAHVWLSPTRACLTSFKGTFVDRSRLLIWTTIPSSLFSLFPTIEGAGAGAGRGGRGCPRSRGLHLGRVDCVVTGEGTQRHRVTVCGAVHHAGLDKRAERHLVAAQSKRLASGGTARGGLCRRACRTRGRCRTPLEKRGCYLEQPGITWFFKSCLRP